MTHLTDHQIAEVAYRAGFRSAGLVDAIAICLVESGGYTTAQNTTGNHPPSRDRGLWQINSYWHPEVSDAEAFNPDSCAAATFRISERGSNWHAWTTYNDGSYRKFIARATGAARALPTHPAPYVLHRYLRQGSVGADVAACQHVVAASPDGIFGPATEAQVKAWQARHGLSQDGIVGPVTAHSFGWTWAGPGA